MTVAVSYRNFTTGLRFRDIYLVIYDRRWKRRHGVLGAWHQIKGQMYEQYLREEAQLAKARRRRRSRSDVPF